MKRTSSLSVAKRAVACLSAVAALALTGWFASKTNDLLAERRGPVLPPDVEFVTLGGDVLRPTNFVRFEEEGHRAQPDAGRPLILLFFQTTCAFCDHEIRHFFEHDSLFGRAAVLLISNEPEEVLRSFFEALPLDAGARFTVVRDEYGTIARRFRVTRIPTLFVYDGTGAHLGTFRGMTRADQIASVLGSDEPASRSDTPSQQWKPQP